MALINCPECGKSFSDKADACPNCGCPTKAIISNTSDYGLSSEEAAKKMLGAVEETNRAMAEAESLFDDRNDEVQRKASRDIDLFGGNASYRVIDIAADAKRACDELYATFQSLIPTLDSICRPLLDYNPGGNAIKAVKDMMQHLNEESEIENNYTASLNDRSLGDVLNAKYVPLMENRMIQKFWESQFEMTPEFKEKKRIEQEEKNRILEEKKKREIEEAEREKREYDSWKEQVKIAEEKRNVKRIELNNSLNEEYLSNQKRIKSEKEKKEKCLSEKIEKLNQEINRCNAELFSLNVFNISKKRKLNKEIESYKESLSKNEKEFSELSGWLSEEMKKAEREHKENLEQIEGKLDDYWPIPLSPKEKKTKDEKANRKKMLESATPTQRENERIKEEILHVLSTGAAKTVTEIQPCLSQEVSFQKISMIIKRLCEMGDVEIMVKNQKKYFKITESGMDNIK